jgi:signal transduction histidine kinase/ActR/RegA family two-component response regulator
MDHPMTSADEPPVAMPPAGPPRARSACILLVDDRPENLITFEAALAALGHPIVTAGSGAGALRCLLQHEVAVVLLDMNMPGMDGFETARLIRSRRRNRDTPIIFITSHGDDIQALQGYSMGAVDFILAPVVSEILRSKVGVFLELYERGADVRHQAEKLWRQTRRLQALTRASHKIHSAPSVELTLQYAADAVREIIGARRAATLVVVHPSGVRQQHQAFSPEQRTEGARRQAVDLKKLNLVSSRCRTFAPAELRELLPADQAPPADRALAAPLVGRDGDILGLLLAMENASSDFDRAEDEELLMQLAQMAATAMENTLFVEARESNRIKDEFLATLSHELRTPLSSILGWAQLLKTKLLNLEETEEAVEIIERNAQMQSKLIEDLLDVSRIITGKMQLNLARIRLAPVILAAVDVVLPAARAKGVDIDAAGIDRAPDCVLGDADRLQQVFWNLLSNAVKFTRARGQIEVRLDSDGAHVEVAVSDNGEGIDPQFLPHVFDRFRQADSSRNRMHAGLGIGLAIVRHVVELHGGSVRGASEGTGRGTTFAVNLPIAPDEQEEIAAPGRDASCEEATLLH